MHLFLAVYLVSVFALLHAASIKEDGYGLKQILEKLAKKKPLHAQGHAPGVEGTADTVEHHGHHGKLPGITFNVEQTLLHGEAGILKNADCGDIAFNTDVENLEEVQMSDVSGVLVDLSTNIANLTGTIQQIDLASLETQPTDPFDEHIAAHIAAFEEVTDALVDSATAGACVYIQLYNVFQQLILAGGDDSFGEDVCDKSYDQVQELLNGASVDDVVANLGATWQVTWGETWFENLGSNIRSDLQCLVEDIEDYATFLSTADGSLSVRGAQVALAGVTTMSSFISHDISGLVVALDVADQLLTGIEALNVKQKHAEKQQEREYSELMKMISGLQDVLDKAKKTTMMPEPYARKETKKPQY